MRLLFFCIICIAIMFVNTGFAQIYRYVDQEGSVRFTDNPASVPEESQEGVKTMAEIKASLNQPLATSETSRDEMNVHRQVVDPVESYKAANQEGYDDHQSAKESLALERSEIQVLYDQIEKDRKSLENPLPESASRIERMVYHQQILDLNQRIDDYQKRVDAYRIKLEAFNFGIQP
jgi:chromosome segregation ATPase